MHIGSGERLQEWPGSASDRTRTCESGFREQDLGSGESFEDVYGALAERARHGMKFGGDFRRLPPLGILPRQGFHSGGEEWVDQERFCRGEFTAFQWIS
jgi:hypothetical protein